MALQSRLDRQYLLQGRFTSSRSVSANERSTCGKIGRILHTIWVYSHPYARDFNTGSSLQKSALTPVPTDPTSTASPVKRRCMAPKVCKFRDTVVVKRNKASYNQFKAPPDGRFRDKTKPRIRAPLGGAKDTSGGIATASMPPSTGSHKEIKLNLC